MRMHAESLARSDDVFVEHAERAELHVRGIIVLIERKSMVRIEPTDVVVAAFFTGANLNHGLPPYSLFENSRAIPWSSMLQRHRLRVPGDGKARAAFPARRA